MTQDQDNTYDPEREEAKRALRAASLSDGSISRTLYEQFRVGSSESLPSASTISRLYGTWAAAVEAAGLHTSYRRLSTHPKELLEARREHSIQVVKRAYKDLGGPSITRSFYVEWLERQPDREDLPSASTLTSPFSGSWFYLREAAGIDHPTYVRNQYSVADVRRTLDQAIQDGVTTASEYREWSRGRKGVPSLATVINLLGSWTYAVESREKTRNPRQNG